MTDATIKTNQNGIGCTVTFATHQDLTATVLQAPPCECWVEPVKTERLVADQQNKAAGINQYLLPASDRIATIQGRYRGIKRAGEKQPSWNLIKAAYWYTKYILRTWFCVRDCCPGCTSSTACTA
eukprot:3060278-Rhodomonas_salina.1